MFGHLTILLAVEETKPLIFKEDWLQKTFDPASVKASVDAICR